MIEWIIDWSIRHRLIVLLATVAFVSAAAFSARDLPLDALPDLSDTQVIVRASYAGHAPQLVDNQVTYPITSGLLALKDATYVRGFSMFGESYVYVIFASNVDPAVARTRVSERLAQIREQLPEGVTPTLGPDASGTGWIFEYSLIDHSKRVPPDRLRALQDYYLRPELQSVAGVAEVASVGGSPRQFEVQVDPRKLASLNIRMSEVADSVRDANQSIGGGTLEMSRSQYALRADGQLHSPADFDDIPVAASNGSTIRLRQIANVAVVPKVQEGLTDVDGKGEAVSGIVVMRQGENTLATIKRVRAKLDALKSGLPPGVEVVTQYDRSTLIHKAIETLDHKLVEESLAVAFVCVIFLFHLRSSLAAIATLPVGILGAMLVLRLQGSSANIMSLGGIAIAIGAMIDASIVMIESLHRRLESHPQPNATQRWVLVRETAIDVGPSLFFSLAIITLSFLSIFGLSDEQAKLFFPLAFTKTYSMAFGAVLSITLTPVLMGYAVRGRVRREAENPLNRGLQRVYRPVLRGALQHPKLALGLGFVALLSASLPLARVGTEFMPTLNEGDLLYMPSTVASIATKEAQNVLQITDRLILGVPEVAHVFGKAGHADTATDPAPMSMFETVVQLKPREAWPRGETVQQVIEKLEAATQLPGLRSSWGFPIRTRIDMVSTGIRSQLAVKVSGARRSDIEAAAKQVESVLGAVPGARSVFWERTEAGRYLDIDIHRQVAAALGARISDIRDALDNGAGGKIIDSVNDGREIIPVSMRYPSAFRDSPEAIGDLRVQTVTGTTVALRQLATIRVADGPSEIRSENARLIEYVYVDPADSDVGGFYKRAADALSRAHIARDGVSLEWAGQYLRFDQQRARLWTIAALTGLVALGVLYMHLRSWLRVGLVSLCVPFAVSGALWLVYLLGYEISTAVVVGLIALAGVSIEFGIVMLLYLDRATGNLPETANTAENEEPLRNAIISGALLRLRPKTMTVSVILAGLLPIMLSDATGAEVMKRIATPLLGGMISAPLFSLLLMPVLYEWLSNHERRVAALRDEVEGVH